MGVTTERRRKFSPTYMQGIAMPERPHTLEEYALDHFRSRWDRRGKKRGLGPNLKTGGQKRGAWDQILRQEGRAEGLETKS